MYKYKAKCFNVVDGDTIDLDIDLGFDIHIKDRVRLEGIDTPEVRTTDEIQKEAGLLVKKFVEDLILGKEVYLHSKEFKKDKYDRIVGDIYLLPHDVETNVSLCSILVNKAYAKYYNGKSMWSTSQLVYITEELK